MGAANLQPPFLQFSFSQYRYESGTYFCAHAGPLMPIHAGASTKTRSRQGSREISFSPAAEFKKKEPDLAQILREMEDELARDVNRVTAERSTFERAEKDEQKTQLAAELSADTTAKIEAAAMEMREIEAQQTMKGPDRLHTIRARRRTKDLEAEAMDLLNASLESVFKTAASDGDGTLDRDEVEAAFKKSETLHFSDESLLPILEDILEKNGGRASFEQFKEIAWKASVKSAVPHVLHAPPPSVHPENVHPERQSQDGIDRAGTFIV